MKYISRCEQDTLNFARNMAYEVKGGTVITLNGQLGAGKTVFCKGFAEGLGISDEVTSPTFTIMNVYEGRLTLCHIDAYRLKNGEEAYSAGLCDYIGADGVVCVIEWAENIQSVLPQERTDIEIIVLDQNTREIRVNDK